MTPSLAPSHVKGKVGKGSYPQNRERVHGVSAASHVPLRNLLLSQGYYSLLIVINLSSVSRAFPVSISFSARLIPS